MRRGDETMRVMQHGAMQHDAAAAAGRKFLRPPAMPSSPRETGPLDIQRLPEIAEPMDVEALIGLATQHNPALRQARLQVRGAMGAAIQAGLYPNPVIGYQAEQIGVEGTAGEFHGMRVSQKIVTAGKLEVSRRKYLQRVQAAEALAVAQQYRVCNDIRLHYFEFLGHSQMVEIHQELVKSAEDSALTLREQYNVGQANRAAVWRSNAMLQRARLKLLSAENARLQSGRRLAAIIGCQIELSEVTGQLDGPVETFEFQAVQTHILANSPELLAARAKLRSDQITLQREQIEPIPDVTVEAATGYNFEANDAVSSVGVSLPLPLWNRNQGTIMQARADLSRQHAEIRRLESDLSRRLADQYRMYISAAQHVAEYQRSILPDLKSAYRAHLQSYKANRAEWPDVLASQKDYFEAKQEYIAELTKWRKAETLIQGMLLHGALAPVDGPTPAGHIDATPQPR